MLAALVAALMHADLVIVLTDTDGLYSEDPRKSPTATRIPFVQKITPAVTALAGGSGSSVGTGGMAAKVRAAAQALRMGVPVFIGQPGTPGGKEEDYSLLPVVAGTGRGTYFGEESSVSPGRKVQWIAFHSESRGRIVIDQGAIQAVREGGKSLLPAGVVSVEGIFDQGDVVIIADPEGTPLGRGIVNYKAEELRAVAGKSTRYAAEHVGRARVEVVHRDDLILL
jgi:glutamate 5-kinase